MDTVTFEQRSFLNGVLCGMLLMVGVDGVHWFLTPLAHPEASTSQMLAVAAQVMLCFSVAAWLYGHRRRSGGHTSPQAKA